ncbi:MAG: isoprenylcysteine carboxylmethyltransferase family protein [Bacteroidota bacterium]
MKSEKTVWDYFYVAIQGLLFLTYALVPSEFLSFHLPTPITYLGLLLSICGLGTCGLALLQLNKNLSPFPTPLRDGQLVTHGMYRLARHPIYTGLLLLFFGYALFSSSGLRLLLSLGLGILFHFKSSYEERLLTQKFPAYSEYQEEVGRFSPWW